MMACLTDMPLGLMFKIATKIQHFESASDIVSDSLTNEPHMPMQLFVSK